MTEPRVEAGDRVLEVLAEIMEMAPIRHTLGLNHTYESGCRCLRCAADSAVESGQSAMNAQERELREALRQHGVLIQAAKAVLETAGVLRAYDVGGGSGDVKPFCEALNDLEDAIGVIEGLSELRDGKTKSIDEVRAEAERLLAERGEL